MREGSRVIQDKLRTAAKAAGVEDPILSADTMYACEVIAFAIRIGLDPIALFDQAHGKGDDNEVIDSDRRRDSCNFVSVERVLVGE